MQKTKGRRSKSVRTRGVPHERFPRSERENSQAVRALSVSAVQAHRLEDGVEPSRVEGSSDDVVESAMARNPTGAKAARKGMKAKNINGSTASTAMVLAHSQIKT